ncbi:MAG: serine/threonine-protein kinase [Spirochaetaceae bacterium]|jgi:serine/threonine protein kinase|nr:serine/threonine-protein kinase [Spirochaetaceae bacterium]
MADLPKGFSIKTRNMAKVVVDQKLGEGGQGAVYQVDYNGASKALKWYSGKKIKAPGKFYANLENNIKRARPSDAFLWPEDITVKSGAAFGYIMDLRPPEYKDFTKFLIGREGFASITAMTNAALQITAGFRELHRKGCSYQDLNDGNFFINPKNGDVLICDNDNVSEYGKNSGIAGKARYMAPEIVAKNARPDIKTDRFSLSVVLFMLWTNNHPLEGKAACPVCMDAAHEKKIYGETPVFIFDPDDKSNRPVHGLHKGAINRWPFLPRYAQELFIKAFSKDALSNPANRIIEQDWLRLFIRMRGEIYKCPCGEVYFADPAAPNPCPACGKANTFPLYIKTYRYNLPVHQRAKLYTCHTEKDSDDFETLAGEISAADGVFKLKNVSGKSWSISEGGDKMPQATIEPNAAFMLKKGMSISFGSAEAEII